jgi:hypothetical protein
VARADPDHFSFRDALDKQVQSVVRLASWAASTLGGFGVVVSLGLSPLPNSFPLVTLARDNPPFALLLGGLLATLLIAIIIRIRRRGSPLSASSLGAGAARFVFSTIVTAVTGSALSILFGFGDLPANLPVIDLLRQRPPLGIALLIVLIALVVFSPLFLQGAPAPEELANSKHMRRLIASLIISLLSSLLFVGLLGMVIVRPSWCLSTICPAPVVVVSPNGVHDTNLDIAYQDVQSAFFQLPGDPSAPGATQPTTVAAEEVDDPLCTRAPSDVRCPAFRQVLTLHSLQRGASQSILVQEVLVTIDRVSPLPGTLNVWHHTLDTLYTSQPYLVTYRGQPAGTVLAAVSQHNPPTFLHLGAGEGDQIDLGIISEQATGIIAFHVTVVYTTSSDTQLHQLVLLTAKATDRQLILANRVDMRSYLPTGSGFVPEATPSSQP